MPAFSAQDDVRMVFSSILYDADTRLAIHDLKQSSFSYDVPGERVFCCIRAANWAMPLPPCFWCETSFPTTWSIRHDPDECPNRPSRHVGQNNAWRWHPGDEVMYAPQEIMDLQAQRLLWLFSCGLHNAQFHHLVAVVVQTSYHLQWVLAIISCLLWRLDLLPNVRLLADLLQHLQLHDLLWTSNSHSKHVDNLALLCHSQSQALRLRHLEALQLILELVCHWLLWQLQYQKRQVQFQESNLLWISSCSTMRLSD